MRTKAGARAKPQPRPKPSPIHTRPNPRPNPRPDPFQTRSIPNPTRSKPNPVQTRSDPDPIQTRSEPLEGEDPSCPIQSPGGRESRSIPIPIQVQEPGKTRLLNQPNTNPNRLLIQPLILGSGILSKSSYMETDPAGLKHESPEAHRMGMWKGRPRTQSLTRTNPLVGKDQRHTSRTETETCGVDRKPLSGGSKESGWRNKWRNSPDEW